MKLKLTEEIIPKLNTDKSDVCFVTVPNTTDIIVSFPQHISKFNDWYWIYSDSYKDHYGDNYFASAASPEGKYVSSKLMNEKCQVRPVLEMHVSNKKNIPFLEDGNIVNCFGHNWYVYDSKIPTVKLFCMDSIGSCEFSSNIKFPCKYINSDLYKFVKNWWNSIKEEHFRAKIYDGHFLIDIIYSNDFREITDFIDQEIKEGYCVEFKNMINGKSMTLTPKDYEN